MPIPSQPVYDFEVPGYANYLTAGIIHHNSEAGCVEDAYHLTGLYPKDWEGHRWHHPVDGWMAGVTTKTVRDISQTKLCGPSGSVEDFGTGFIPRHCFVDKPTLQRHASVADCYEGIRVWHHDEHGQRDGVSTGQFLSYEQGSAKFQGPTRHFVHWDEEPPPDVHVEGEARYSAIPGGRSWMTFTPVKGPTTIVNMFFENDDPNRGLVIIGIDDVLEGGIWTPEMVEDARRKYPSHEWPARLYGQPNQGIGRIFITGEEQIVFPVDQVIPPHWALLWGVDFGFTHPFAAVLAAVDKEADVIYLLHTYRAAETFPVMHAEAIRRVAAQAPIAWPHDGGDRTSSADGTPIAQIYKNFDLKMLHESARWPDGGKSTEAAVLEMQQRFADGRLRVREDLADFLQEYRGYHRELTKQGNSVIVKKRDDLISCVQKIMMMKRYAKSVPMGFVKARPKMARWQRENEPALPINPWTGREDRRWLQ